METTIANEPMAHNEWTNISYAQHDIGQAFALVRGENAQAAAADFIDLVARLKTHWGDKIQVGDIPQPGAMYNFETMKKGIIGPYEGETVVKGYTPEVRVWHMHYRALVEVKK